MGCPSASGDLSSMAACSRPSARAPWRGKTDGGERMRKLTPHEARITEWLDDQKERMLALLAEVVNIDSGSYHKSGVDTVGERFVRFFGKEGLITTIEPHERFGDAI